MTLIGFIHYRKNPEGLRKAYAFATVAKAEGAELLFFSPGAVDFENKKINGYIYENGKWIKVRSDFPGVICNITGLSKDNQNKIADRLREEIPFTSNSIGSKMTVFKNLTKYKKFSDYLIPTEEIESAEHFFNFAGKYKNIVFKPSMGCQGTGVYFIEKKNAGSYETMSGGNKIIYDFAGMSEFILNKINEDEYLAQPYINCRTKDGNPYDFRLHAQKNIRGEWVSVRIYPRISLNDSIVCNLSSDGYTTGLTTFLKQEFGNEYYDVKRYLEAFSVQFAGHMNEIQRELYEEELDELGIDVGLDENGRICLYEVNWRPGYPPSVDCDLNAVKNIIHYSMYLAKKNMKKSIM